MVGCPVCGSVSWRIARSTRKRCSASSRDSISTPGVLYEAAVVVGRAADVTLLLVHAADVEQVVRVRVEAVGLLEQPRGGVVVAGLEALDRPGR